tara:strand:- start:1390 stop:5247 length:3858 start_codon:yes stop_codon:yes gene_type:complete
MQQPFNPIANQDQFAAPQGRGDMPGSPFYGVPRRMQQETATPQQQQQLAGTGGPSMERPQPMAGLDASTVSLDMLPQEQALQAPRSAPQRLIAGPVGGPGSAPGGAGFARPLSAPPSLGGGPAGGGGGGPALGQQEWRLKIEPVERKAGGMITGYQEGGDLERTQAVLARRRAAAEREIASRQPIEIEGLDVVVPRTMEVVRRREHPGGMPSRERTTVNTSPQMEPFTQKAANQLTEREIQELYLEPQRRRDQEALIDAIGQIQIPEGPSLERELPLTSASFAEPSLIDSQDILESMERIRQERMLRMARNADRRIGRPSADLSEIGMPFEDFGIEDFMVEPGDFQKPLAPSGMLRPQMIEGLEVTKSPIEYITGAGGNIQVAIDGGGAGDFVRHRRGSVGSIPESLDARRGRHYKQYGHFPLFPDDPGAERMLRQLLEGRQGITGLAGGGMIPMYGQGGEIEGYFLGGLMKGIKSLGKGLGKVAGAAAPFASMIPGVGTLAGAGLAGLGTIAGDLSSGRGFSLGNIARNVGRSVALGGIADKLKGIEGLKGKGILGGIKEAFTNQDVGKEILGAVGDVNVGDALALTVGEAAGQRADAQQAAEQGGFGGMGMANPMSTAGRAMPPGVQGTVPAQAGVAGQLTYGNQPVVYRGEGGMIPEYQIGGMMGEEMNQFLPNTMQGARRSRLMRPRNVKRLAPPPQPQPVAPPAPPMAAGPDMMQPMPPPTAAPPAGVPPVAAPRGAPTPEMAPQGAPTAAMAPRGAPTPEMAPPTAFVPPPAASPADRPMPQPAPMSSDLEQVRSAIPNTAAGIDNTLARQKATLGPTEGGFQPFVEPQDTMPESTLDSVRAAVPQTAAAMDFGMTEEGETGGRRSRRGDRGQGDESEDRSRRGEAGGEGRGPMGSEGGGERREERRSRDSGRRGEEGGELGGERGETTSGAEDTGRGFSYEEGDYKYGDRMTEAQERMAERFGTQDEFGDEDESAKMENIRAIAQGKPADDIASVDGSFVENTSKFDPTPTSLPGIQNPDLLAQRDAELMAPKQQRTMPTAPAAPTAPQTAGTLQDSGAGSGFFGEKKWFDPNAAQPATRDIGGMNPHDLPKTAADFQAAGDEGGAGLLARLGMAEGGMVESMEPQDMQALAQAAMQLESPDSMNTIKMLMDKYQLSAQDINGLLQALSQQAAAGMQQPMQEGGLINGGNGDAMADDIFVDATMNANGDTQTIAVSAGEYIVPGDAVAHLGSGNTERGADVMDQFVEDIRIDRTGTAVQPEPINLEDVLPLSYGDRYA